MRPPKPPNAKKEKPSKGDLNRAREESVVAWKHFRSSEWGTLVKSQLKEGLRIACWLCVRACSVASDALRPRRL